MKKKTSKPAKIAASPALIEDLVAASRILAKEGVLDGYGHISARSDQRPDHFIMSRSRAPALVTAADLMQLNPESDPRPATSEKIIEATSTAISPHAQRVILWCTAIRFGQPLGSLNPLRPVYHIGSFLWSGAPGWESARSAGHDVGARPPLERACDRAGKCSLLPGLLPRHDRGRDGIQEALFRAIYTDIPPPEIQPSSSRPIEFLSAQEAALHPANRARCTAVGSVRRAL